MPAVDQWHLDIHLQVHGVGADIGHKPAGRTPRFNEFAITGKISKGDGAGHDGGLTQSRKGVCRKAGGVSS